MCSKRFSPSSANTDPLPLLIRPNTHTCTSLRTEKKQEKLYTYTHKECVILIDREGLALVLGGLLAALFYRLIRSIWYGFDQIIFISVVRKAGTSGAPGGDRENGVAQRTTTEEYHIFRTRDPGSLTLPRHQIYNLLDIARSRRISAAVDLICRDVNTRPCRCGRPSTFSELRKYFHGSSPALPRPDWISS